MGSPFPGMDPYIEVSNLWEDFHNKLIGDIELALSQEIPVRYAVRIGKRSYFALLQADEDEELFLPDVAVFSDFQPPTVECRETFLEIWQIEPERKLVTG